MTTAEYLEKLFGDAFKRESDQDENVNRSLPFVIAALGLLVTILNLAGQHLPPLRFEAYSLFVHLLVVVAGGCVLGVLWCLHQAVRPRTYRYPPPETELLNWSEALRGYYSKRGLQGDALEEAVVGHVRGKMVEEFAQATVQNRMANAARLGIRALALVLLVIALGLVFLTAAAIFAYDRFAVSLDTRGHASHVEVIRPTAQASRTVAPAKPAPVAVHHSGRAPAVDR